MAPGRTAHAPANRESGLFRRRRDPETVHLRRTGRLSRPLLVRSAGRHEEPGAHLRRPGRPGRATGLPEAVPASPELPGGGRQGKNDFGKLGYGGPCPPKGTHRYDFKLYALDVETKLPAGATKAQLLRAIEGHVLAEAKLTGKYSRS
jgi:hypothetical protein